MSNAKAILAAVLSSAICLVGLTECCLAQSRFETTPYAVRIVLTTDGSSVWTKETLHRLKTKLVSGIESGFGRMVNVEFDLDSGADLRQHDLSLLTRSLAASIVALSTEDRNRQLEKVIYLQLQQHPDQFRICAVEHDLRYKYVGSPSELSCPTMQHVEQNLLRVVAGAFGGNARLMGVENGIIKLRARASLVPARDRSLDVCPEGAVLQLLPIGQQEIAGVENEADADATTDKAVWRFIVVQKADPLSSRCALLTRFYEETGDLPVGQLVARQIHPIHNHTTIKFSNRDDQSPLAGLEVEILDRSGNSLQHSKSDARGRLVVSRRSRGRRVAMASADQHEKEKPGSPLVELVVRCHHQEVLRFPVVVGWQRHIACPLTLSPQRLAGLAALQVHRAELNDWIAHREIVMARAASDQSASAKLLKDLDVAAEARRSALEAKISRDAKRFTTDSHHWQQLSQDVTREMKVN